MLPTRSIFGFLLLLLASTQLAGCAAGASAEASRAPGYPGSASVVASANKSTFDEGEASSDLDMAPAAPPTEAAAPAPEAAGGYGYSAQAGGPAPAPARSAPTTTPGAPASGSTSHEEAQNGEPSAVGGEDKRAPLLIYNAVLTLAVFEATEAIDTIEKLAVDSGGYLVQRGDRHITIRVPSKAFRPALDKVETLGDELHREVNVRDVTEEFSDLEIRLQNARAVRARLEELLRQATTVEDALAVQKELERVTEEIERMLGRLKLLRELVAFSTITVRFEARPTDVVDSHVTLPFPWLHELGLPRLLSM
jgi:hypothetical protein